MTRRSNWLLVLITGLLLASSSREAAGQQCVEGEPCDSAGTERARCRIERVTDGDTIRCTDGRRVRLLLIDAPERDQGRFGDLASAFVRRLLPVGSKVRLEYDVERHDRYGRDLAYVYTADGAMVNEEIVRAGFAVVSVYPPNVRYVERMRAAAQEAREARRGLWSGSAFECLPSQHRRGAC